VTLAEAVASLFVAGTSLICAGPAFPGPHFQQGEQLGPQQLSLQHAPQSAAAQTAPEPQRSEVSPPTLEEAVQMIFSDYEVAAQYHYVMTGKIRLLLFWLGDDDVGDGYVRLEHGLERPELEMIRLRIGSDPSKAPRDINRWGAAAEVIEHDPGNSGVPRSSAFFGFMKATKGTSIRAVESELSREQEDHRYRFEASINRVQRETARSSVFSVSSPVDLNFRQMAEAERMVLDEYADVLSSSLIRELHGDARGGCDRIEGFLFTIKEITEAALSGQDTPVSWCYLYNSRYFDMTLTKADRIDEKKISYELNGGRDVVRSYRDLLELQFEVRKRITGKRDKFRLLLATSTELRGVPVQITYQPNWWFKIILNLHTATGDGVPLSMKPPL